MKTSKGKRIKTIELVLIALMAALLCIVGPVTVPVGIVPVSAMIVLLYLIVYILGTWKAAVSCLIYLCIGMVGLPVFAGYAAGPAVLFGPTGGYLIGYLLLTVCSGLFIEHVQRKRFHLFGMLLGLLACYLLGTVWLMLQADMTFVQAVMTGVVPFLLFDLIKVAAAFLLGPVFRRHLRRANLFT